MASLSEVLNPPLKLAPSLWNLLDAVDGFHQAVTAIYQDASHLSNLIDDPPEAKADYLSWNFAQLRRAVLLVASKLLEQGVDRGEGRLRMLTFLPNGVECILMLWVSAVLELRHVPLDANMLHPDRHEQLQHHLSSAESGNTVVVVSDRTAAERIENMLDSAGLELRAKCIIGHDPLSGWISLADISSTSTSMERLQKPSHASQYASHNGEYDRTAVVLHTSGTSTGKPKGCPLSVRNVLSACASKCAFTQLTDCFLTSAPSFGAIYTIMAFLCGACGMEFLMPATAFSPAHTLAAIEKFPARAITTICIPAQIRLLAIELQKREQNSPQQPGLSNVKRVMLGGDLVTEDVLLQAQQIFPHAKVSSSHGMTEACGVLGFSGQSIERMPVHHGIVSVGKPAIGSNVRIVQSADQLQRAEKSSVIPRNQVGDLHISGSGVIDRYVDDAQPEAFYHDGSEKWLVTGDHAMMDDAGFVFILGRAKVVVKKMGLSLSPAMAESVLRRLAGVDAAVVLGIPSEDYGEVPVAIVKLRKGEVSDTIEKGKLASTVAGTLGEHYTLDRVLELHELGLDNWPMNPTGKVMKATLKEKVVALLRES